MSSRWRSPMPTPRRSTPSTSSSATSAHSPPQSDDLLVRFVALCFAPSSPLGQSVFEPQCHEFADYYYTPMVFSPFRRVPALYILFRQYVFFIASPMTDHPNITF